MFTYTRNEERTKFSVDALFTREQGYVHVEVKLDPEVVRKPVEGEEVNIKLVRPGRPLTFRCDAEVEAGMKTYQTWPYTVDGVFSNDKIYCPYYFRNVKHVDLVPRKKDPSPLHLERAGEFRGGNRVDFVITAPGSYTIAVPEFFDIDIKSDLPGLIDLRERRFMGLYVSCASVTYPGYSGMSVPCGSTWSYDQFGSRDDCMVNVRCEKARIELPDGRF
jgi:hypothetical protein